RPAHRDIAARAGRPGGAGGAGRPRPRTNPSGRAPEPSPRPAAPGGGGRPARLRRVCDPRMGPAGTRPPRRRTLDLALRIGPRRSREGLQLLGDAMHNDPPEALVKAAIAFFGAGTAVAIII